MVRIKIILILCVLFLTQSAFAGTGACCLNGGVCYQMNVETCQVWGGVWTSGATCDEVVCETNCEGSCSPNEILDCNGNCAPISWIGDGYCDDGQYQWDTNSIYLNCAEFGYDGGDCPPEDEPTNSGACCIGALNDCDGRVCENQLYSDCLNLGGQYLGENTICVDQACSCPLGMTADCNGNCFPIHYLDDGLCHDGHWYPENGDDAFAYQLNLSCLELACDVGDCTGICGGACCIGHECVEGLAFNVCADKGGTFLGGGETCIDVDCLHYLVPQTVGVELQGLQSPISGEFGRIVSAKEGVFVLGLVDATLKSNGNTVAACNVYRNNESLAETLYFETASDPFEVYVATDGVRIVLAADSVAHVYKDVGGSFVYEQAIAIGNSIHNVSISGDNIFIVDNESWSGGGVSWFARSGNSWIQQNLQFINTGVKKTVIDGNNIAVLGLFSLIMYELEGGVWNTLESFSTNGTSQDVDIDDEFVLLGETTDYYPGTQSLAQATLIEKVDGAWIIAEHLIPVDVLPDDEYALSVSIENNIACISLPLSDSTVINGGSVAVFRELGGVWKYTNKLLPGNAIPTMQFGSQIAVSGSGFISTWEAAGPDPWTPGANGAQFLTLADYDWFNPQGGLIGTASNWIPSLPSTNDSVSIAIPAEFELGVNGSLPFLNLHVATSKPTLNLNGLDVFMQGSLQVEGASNYTGDLDISQGQFGIVGNATIGSELRPGAISIQDGASLVVQGDFTLHRNSQLHIELSSSSTVPLQLENASSLQGSLIVTSAIADFNPGIGDEWVLFTSAQPVELDDLFSVIVMPGIGSDKYFALSYLPLVQGTQLVATVQAVDNLYDLEGADSIDISGTATDVVVADLGSASGGADGLDDIALSISGSPGSVYIFLNDGSGGVSTQITYAAGSNPTSIDAGDIDGDGKNDLVVTNGGDDNFFVLLNDGSDASAMTQLAPISTGDLPVDVVFTNIDDDGDNDIVVACYGEEDILPDGTVPGELRFYEVSPSLRISISQVGYFPLEKPDKIDPGDVNNDKDFVLSISLRLGGKVAMMGRSGAVRGFDWVEVQHIDVGANPSSIQTGDLDNDGDADAVVANEGSTTISILQMGATNLYESELVIEVGNAPSSVELLDFDGDGDLDLAVIASNVSSQRVVYVYRNDTSLNSGQNITFALEQILDEGANPILLGSGEIDGDTAADLVSILGAPAFRGASESTVTIKSTPSRPSCPGDFDNSGIVNVIDLLAVIGYWGSPDGDLNGDGTTDVADVLALIALWGSCE